MAQNTFTTPIDTQEIDSDPYSDSDEESIASKSPSLPPKPEKSALNDESASSDSAGSSHHIEHGVPRKLQRARRCIHTAIKNLVDITLRDSPSSGANSKGGRGAWEELGLSLSGLIGCLDDRVLADVPTRSHLGRSYYIKPLLELTKRSRTDPPHLPPPCPPRSLQGVSPKLDQA